MPFIGQVKKTTLKVGRKSLPAKWKWNGAIYLIEVPSVHSQFIGTGRTITAAKADAIKTIKKFNWRV